MFPLDFILVNLGTLPNNRLQHFGETVSEAATTVIAKNVRVLVEKNGQSLRKIADKYLARQENLPLAITS